MAVYGRLKSYVDSIIAFERDIKLGTEVLTKNITVSRLLVAIPPGATDAQVVQILRAKAYAEARGIPFFVSIVEEP